MTCPHCQSPNYKKFGFNRRKDGELVQKYRCKDCNKMWCYNDRLPRTHLRSEIIGVCFDLYFQGLSYRVVQRHLLDNYNLKVHPSNIYHWIQNYTSIIKKYTDTLKPKLSAVWQMDETVIRFKQKPYRGHLYSVGDMCWVCIDTGTRFILDMYLSTDKSLTEGIAFFERITHYIDEKPEIISTDGNISYQTCIKKFYPDCKHVLLKLISLKPNTSFIERYNGTIKNRTKTMRGFDSYFRCQETLTAFQIYYNFLRPHMALDGKTPAQEAGIDIEFPERWVSLIRNALLVSNNFL